MPRDLSEVHPDLRDALRRFPDVTFGPFSTRLMRMANRWLQPPIEAPALGSERREVPSTGRTAWVHRRVTDPAPVLLWLHGGGHILGDPEQRRWADAFTSRADCVVVSAGYRLSPEHPFPASLDDARAAFHWCLESADELGIDPSRIVIGGESAGGGLAASLVQRLTDEGHPLAGQLLVYPMLDDRTTVRADIGAKQHLVWNNASNRYGWTSFLGHPPGNRTTAPYAVPARRDDLDGLPPAWIGVGDLDLFLDENADYARRLREAGVPTEFIVVEGGPHGFPSVAPSVAVSVRFLDSAAQFLAQVLDAS